MTNLLLHFSKPSVRRCTLALAGARELVAAGHHEAVAA
jgi:hypothetical protein